MYAINETHDPDLVCSVDSANHAESAFPIQNLPLGVFGRNGEEPRIGCAIGDQILDLRACVDHELIQEIGDDATHGAEHGHFDTSG